MTQDTPPEVPTVHHLHQTLMAAHAKHVRLHQLHHTRAHRVAAERQAAVAKGQTPTVPPTLMGAAPSEGAGPPSGGRP